MADLGFKHRFEAGAIGLTVLALHGTGGDEDDLLPLARLLAPGASVLSPRGRVLENGMPRFFRRLAEGVFDADDVKEQALALARFIEAARRQYAFGDGPLVALGFSNGANIASALLLLRPQALAHAALLRPMVPFDPDPLPDLRGKRIFLASGRRDPVVPVANAEALAALYRQAGGEVTHEWSAASHGLIQSDITAAQAWFKTLL